MPAIKGKPSWNKGIPHTAEHKEKIGAALRGRKSPIKGEQRYNWKGEQVGYLGLHSWVKRELGSPQICSLEDGTCKGRLEWANKSHKYKRSLDDWIPLCISHHRRYDGIKPKYRSGYSLTEEHKVKIGEGVRR